MSKAKDRAQAAYPTWKNGIGDEFSSHSAYYGFIEGYEQAEKDLIENKHEKSWRLDKQLWSGFNDIEEASYQYIYDASNDWAYEIPTWHDVQDAFKAGSKWKENIELTWEDIEKITDIYDDLHEDETVCIKTGYDTPEFYKEMLKQFKNYKERKEE